MNLEPLNTHNITINEGEACEAFYVGRYRRRYATEHPDMLSFFEQNLLFVTVTFHPYSISAKPFHKIVSKRWPPKPHPLALFNVLYFLAMKEIIGNNLQRKRDRQAFGIAWVDFEGTRSGTGTIDLKSARNAHVHALLLTDPQYRDHLQDCFANWLQLDPWCAYSDKLGAIDAVDIRRYDRTKSSVRELIEYCSKGYAKLPASIREDFKLICPK